jgi:uncharacterized protein (DUF849 family)
VLSICDARRVLVKACLNGARRPSEHPALPVTAEALARDAAAVRHAGARAVHLHVKDAEGADTFGGSELAEALQAVRAAAPGLPVGVTTGAWALPDPAERVAAIQAWTVLPDFASVNWHEDGADEVAAALLARGIRVEAGLWHAQAVGAFLRSPYRDRCLRVLLELPDGLGEAETRLELGRLLDQLQTGLGERFAAQALLLHGESSSCWPALREAVRLGLDTRIGLEDTLQLPDGSLASNNADLVTAARGLIFGGPT